MQAKKKILIFSLAYEPYIGGAEIAIQEITDRLPEIEFHIITSKGLKMYPMPPGLKDEEQIRNTKVYRIGNGRSVDQYHYVHRAYKLAQRLHQENKYDLVWAVLESQAGMAAARFKNSFPDIPYVLNLQSGDSGRFWFLRTFFWRRWYARVYSLADHVHAISNFLAAKAKKLGAQQVSVIPNGVDLGKFKAQSAKRKANEIRKIYNIRENDKIIITTSRLVFKNGVDILIDSFSELAGQRDDVKLLVVGTGPLEKELKKIASRRGVGARVIFTGHIDNERIPEYLAVSDIFVRTPRSEGLGISFLEAMAVGVPVIGTNVGGIADFLEQGVTGLLAESFEPAEIATKMDVLLGDKALQKKVTKNASKLVIENYDWDKIAGEVGDIFSDLIESPPLTKGRIEEGSL